MGRTPHKQGYYTHNFYNTMWQTQSAEAYMNEQRRGRIRPQKTVGIVSFNVATSADMITEGVTNKYPKWSLANGIYRDYVDNIETGDILYKYNDIESPNQSGLGQPFHPGSDTTTVRILSVLNGQGDAKESESVFESRCTIMGLAEYGKVNGKERLTGARIGIMTVKNNGPYIISTGDRIIARAPTKLQIKEAVKNTGENAGIVKFQLQPYQPSMHKTQPKEIYACLVAGNDSGRLPAYQQHCRQLTDAHAASSMVTIITQWNKIKTIMETPAIGTKAARSLALLKFLGHSQITREQNEEVRDSLFTPYSKTKNNKTPYIFSTENPTDDEIRVNRIQESSMSQAIESNAYFTREITNLELGTAMSPAKQGQDFSLFLDKR